MRIRIGAAMPRQRGQVDDGRALGQVMLHAAEQIEGAVQIDRQRAPLLFVTHLGKGFGQIDPGGRDDEIDAAKGLGCCRDQRLG